MDKSLLPSVHCEKKYLKKNTHRQKTAAPFLNEGYRVKKEPFTSLSTCRVCLKEGDIPIFDKNNSEDIPEALVVFGGIEITKDDAYPKHLCTSCHAILQSAISFRKTAQKSDKIFKMSAKVKKEENCDDILNGVKLNDDAFGFEVPIEKHEEIDCPNPKEEHYFPYCKRGGGEIRTAEELDEHNMPDEHSVELNDNAIDFQIPIEKHNRVDCPKPTKKRQPYCKRCHRKFRTAKELDEHNMSDEHETMRRTCTICQKSYRALYYKRHIELVHTPELPILVCDICGKTFKGPHKGYLSRHRFTHFKELPFKCPQCPYRGRCKPSLKVHMRSHTGEKPYKCSECSACFVTKSNLNRHTLTHAPVRNYQCEICERGFYTEKTLEMHLKIDHTGVKEHICDICGKEFGYRKQMMKHQLKVHKRQKLRSGKQPLYLQVQMNENKECVN